MRRGWLAGVVLSAACASNPVRPADQVQLGHAATLVREGCYDCLLEARDIYARVGVGRAAPLVAPRLLEAELLLALRERELALDSTATEARARALAPVLAPSLDVARLLALVDVVPREENGTPRRTRVAWMRSPAQAVLRNIAEELAWLQTSALGEPARGYLALTLYCGQRRGTRPPYPNVPPLADLQVVGPDAPPLMVYRAATCGGLTIPFLNGLRADAPRFVETAYFLGRASVGMIQQRGNVAETRELVTAAYGRFPASPAVTMLAGRFNQLVGDCAAGLRFYDETLALEPIHEDALLGRTVCLTFLGRRPEAIATATRMIELKTDNVEEAFYWRAWNRWSDKALDDARRDIEAAKAIKSSGEIHTLAGQVEHDQDDLAPAEADLRTARSLSNGQQNCTAAWYLGLVLMKKERWLETAEAFDEARTCYELRVAQSEAGLTRIRANDDLDPEFRDRQIAGFEAAIVEDRSQYHAAAFNAANHFARAGEIEKARSRLEIAAADPALADLVRQLREVIKVRAPGRIS